MQEQCLGCSAVQELELLVGAEVLDLVLLVAVLRIVAESHLDQEGFSEADCHWDASPSAPAAETGRSLPLAEAGRARVCLPGDRGHLLQDTHHSRRPLSRDLRLGRPRTLSVWISRKKSILRRIRLWRSQTYPGRPRATQEMPPIDAARNSASE